MVDSPTRERNILDLFATNRSNLIHKVEVIPGLSDQEVVSIESTISATLTMSRSHTVFKWHLADWQSINKKMHCLSSWFIPNCSIDTEIQELWSIF